MATVQTEEETRQDAALGAFVRLMWDGVAERSSKSEYDMPIPMIFQCYGPDGICHVSVTRQELSLNCDSWERVAEAKLKMLDVVLEEEKGETDG